MEDSSPRSQDHAKLLDYGLDPKVADKLDSIFETGKLSHADLDQRALDALKEFHVDGALTVLNQFVESNLEHVANKSAFLCGVMKTYRQKSRAGVLHDNNGAMSPPPPRGPDQDKIKGILERTGYSLDVTTGQRKYGGPPPDWTGPPPGPGCEVFCGKIPKQLFEDDLIPVFEKCGTLWDLRLMMDPMSGLNRGFAFVTYTTKAEARLAVQELDGYTILERRKIKVNISIPNTRIFVGNIPKSKTQEDIHEAFSSLSAGLVEVIIYSSPNDKKKNRGFCFLEYESHKSASLAKRRLETGRVKVWNCDIIVDWADPQEEPDEETMAKVKVLYCRNLSVDVTEEDLRERFEAYGNIERVKKIKDYAFIHMEAREQAIQAMNALNGLELEGMSLQISLAKPPSDKKKKEDMLRRREDRMMQAMAKSMSMSPFPAMFPPYAAMPGMFSPHGPPTRRHPMSPGGMRGGGAGPSRGGGWANDVGPWGEAGNWGGRGGGWWQDKRDGGYGGARGGDAGYGGARGGDYGGARGGEGGYGASRGGAGSRD